MKSLIILIIISSAALLLWSCSNSNANASAPIDPNKPIPEPVQIPIPENMKIATFGNGCFWCTEAIFQLLKGVSKVESGYSGGHVKNPAYREVSNGTTGHAEAIQITYDPTVISFEELLEVFWKTHDPTTLNQQGADKGTQYRSAIFYHDDEQKRLAEEYKQKLDKAHIWDSPIVTEITPFTNFYKAEDYHQNYYNLNSGQGYCRAVIVPKLEKFRAVFKDKLKETNPHLASPPGLVYAHKW
ncbi:peptide-methionine (S)-S-oxide reductase MsrA [soil metagenome]